MKKSTVYAIIAFIIMLINIPIDNLLTMFVALGAAIVSVHYSVKEKKLNRKKLIP